MFVLLAYLGWILLIFATLIIAFLLYSRRRGAVVASGHTSEAVGSFYNDTTEKFMAVYGENIQAFRTTDVTQYLDYTIASAELKDGQVILDAGCGVGGPASYFASKLAVRVEGLTISTVQVAKSKELLQAKTLKGSVHIQQGDYHQMDRIFGRDVFDRVVFLESFGHSGDQVGLLNSAYQALKPGGMLYIKDLFCREHPNKEDGRNIDRIVDAINESYRYNVPDLNLVLSTIRKLNFILLFIKTPEIKIGEFEHLTISNDFQNLFDIGKIISWDNYVFPVDFYEIKVMKPPFDVNQEKHLYFLNRPQ